MLGSPDTLLVEVLFRLERQDPHGYWVLGLGTRLGRGSWVVGGRYPSAGEGHRG